MRHVHQEVPGRLREGGPPGPGEVINQQSECTAGHRVPPCPGHEGPINRKNRWLSLSLSVSLSECKSSMPQFGPGHHQLRRPPTAPSQKGGGGAHRGKDTSRHEAVVISVLQDLRVKVSDQLVRCQPLLEVSLGHRH